MLLALEAFELMEEAKILMFWMVTLDLPLRSKANCRARRVHVNGDPRYRVAERYRVEVALS